MSQPVYATPQEYADWLNPDQDPGTATPPAGATRALRAASGRIAELVISAYYDVDENDLPTDPDVIAALRDATCAQADYQAGIGDKNSTGAPQQWGSVKLGSASMQRGQSTDGATSAPPRYSSEAYSILQRAELLPAEPLGL